MKFRYIGDVLLSTPLIENLKYHYPNAKIDFALNKECQDMLSLNPNINQIVVYDRARIKNLNIFSRLKAELEFAWHVLRNRYDIVINLTEGERGAILAFLSGAEIKLGLPPNKWLSKVKIFDLLGTDSKQQHTVEKNLQFIGLLGKKIQSRKVTIYWSQDTEKEINEILRKYNIKDFVHAHPVSRWMFKCWEDDRMAKIIDFLQYISKLNL